MDIGKMIASIAPTIGTALGGPLGGMAAKLIVGALGLDANASQDQMATALVNATPDQIAAIKKADNDFAVQMKQLDIDLVRINADNTKSARDMQSATHSRIPGVLSAIITAGYFGILIGNMAGILKFTNNEAMLILLGALATAWGSVINFYFGSSAGSQSKDSLLAARK